MSWPWNSTSRRRHRPRCIEQLDSGPGRCRSNCWWRTKVWLALSLHRGVGTLDERIRQRRLGALRHAAMLPAAAVRPRQAFACRSGPTTRPGRWSIVR